LFADCFDSAAPLQHTQDHLDKPAPADGKPGYEIPTHAEPELVDCMVPKTFHFTAAIELKQSTFRVPWAQFDTGSTYNWISKDLVKTLGREDESKSLNCPRNSEILSTFHSIKVKWSL
jgi:hypothetical protein